MKTQLLEDIGENAGLAPAPALALSAGNPKAGEAVRIPVPVAEPEQASSPPELHSVFEEIAALEAQLVPAVQQHEPDTVPAAPTPGSAPNSAPESAPNSATEPAPNFAPIAPEHPHTLALGPASRLLQPAGRAIAPPTQAPPVQTVPRPQPAYPQDDLAFIPDWVQRPATPQDPLFDFTVPAQGSAAAEPFTRPPAGLMPSGRRYLLWGGCVLSVALLAFGGRWFYQESEDTASLARIANETKAPLTVKQEATGPGAQVQVAAAVQESRPVPALPPLVMLEPDPPGVATPAATKPEPPPPSPPADDLVEPRTPPKPDTAALRKPAAPAPKPTARKPRERTLVAAAPAKEKSKRETVRPPVRAAAIWTETPSQPDTSMTATLKACREYGYGAAQCVKRGCSLTRYGFACRGR